MSFPALCGAKTNSKKPNRCIDFLLNLAASLLQLVTAVVIVGWIFSISWGMHFVNQASKIFIHTMNKFIVYINMLLISAV